MVLLYISGLGFLSLPSAETEVHRDRDHPSVFHWGLPGAQHGAWPPPRHFAENLNTGCVQGLEVGREKKVQRDEGPRICFP